MKISSEQIQNEAVTLTEAIKRLKDTPKEDLYVVLQKLGNEGYIIPMSFASMLVGSQSQGKVYENPADGIYPRVRLQEANGEAAMAVVTVPAGEIWDIVGVMGTLDTGPVVAVRACGITIGQASPLFAAVVNILALTTINIAADEIGVFFMGQGNNHWTNTNGVFAVVANENVLPYPAHGGSVIRMVSTNLGVGDETIISVWYTRRE